MARIVIPEDEGLEAHRRWAINPVLLSQAASQLTEWLREQELA